LGRTRRSAGAGAEPLPPRRKWRAILLATLLLVPSYWALLAGLVSSASDAKAAPSAAPLLAFGLVLLPFVFIVLAFLSEHPRAPNAVLKAMGLSLLVGIPVSALAADAITGLVAGVGAGGVSALRRDEPYDWRARALAVVVATAYMYVTLRTFPDVAVLLGPILPFTSVGIADHLVERRRERSPSAP
jgi:drug/metabolite transporter (DMT)-like permease